MNKMTQEATSTSSSSLFSWHHFSANNHWCGLASASTVASSTLGLLYDRLFFIVASQEVWGRPARSSPITQRKLFHMFFNLAEWITVFSIYLIAWKTLLCLLSRKSAATFQCMYISAIFHNHVLVKSIDESPEFFLNDRRWHQLNSTRRLTVNQTAQNRK